MEWIRLPLAEGIYTKQAHCDLPDGTFEREVGKEGFGGPAAHFVHRHAPTGWLSFDGPVKPRALDFAESKDGHASPWQAPVMMHNSHCEVRWWRLAENMPALARNSDGDQLLFIHDGAGVLFCDWGRLELGEGDYVVMPRGSMWRIEVSQPLAVFMVEATEDSYRLPDKGMLGPHAIFDPAVLVRPVMDDAFRAQQTETETRVVVKRRKSLTTITYPFNPLDALGWHGDLTPVKLNWRDIRPVMSHRYHLPPSVHTTFQCNRFIITTFCPRPIESDPGALKVPFFHNNDDYDEVIFYHKGNFFSRDNIHPGMVSFHPSGFTHGPHPKAFAAGAAAVKKETDEVALMIDARDPLDLTDAALKLEWTGYADSWKVKKDQA
ncbi:homogentisate 1,2-dioxygenase [Chitinimonas arctica]|uniref:Homogentisate 1,2-dioxygenase n=1 Tax=Chitinimonas arctica TaxID=2594795 RepID=A0A516SJB6_9NEIS|nr:homogentisate 1,2-dioxygenase [Chitinimonas arctica]QDQ28138.1 homogentisate 1,2-dioxygenase [Chitinimonas arctica]